MCMNMKYFMYCSCAFTYLRIECRGERNKGGGIKGAALAAAALDLLTETRYAPAPFARHLAADVHARPRASRRVQQMSLLVALSMHPRR